MTKENNLNLLDNQNSTSSPSFGSITSVIPSSDLTFSSNPTLECSSP